MRVLLRVRCHLAPAFVKEPQVTAALNARRAVRRAALMISHTDWTSNIREPPLFLLLLLPRQEKVLQPDEHWCCRSIVEPWFKQPGCSHRGGGKMLTRRPTAHTICVLRNLLRNLAGGSEGLSILTWPSTLCRCHRFGATHLRSLTGCTSVSPHKDSELSADCSGGCNPFTFTTAVKSKRLIHWIPAYARYIPILISFFPMFFFFLSTKRKQPVETRGAPPLRVTGVWPGNTFVFATNSWGDSTCDRLTFSVPENLAGQNEDEADNYKCTTPG